MKTTSLILSGVLLLIAIVSFIGVIHGAIHQLFILILSLLTSVLLFVDNKKATV